jgi:hypothetical protein
VRRIVPLAPTTHATLLPGAAPASKSAVTPLGHGIQVCPESLERSIRPCWPMRQTMFAPNHVAVRR